MFLPISNHAVPITNCNGKDSLHFRKSSTRSIELEYCCLEQNLSSPDKGKGEYRNCPIISTTYES